MAKTQIELIDPPGMLRLIVHRQSFIILQIIQKMRIPTFTLWYFQ
jgi:hypothetical protein